MTSDRDFVHPLALAVIGVARAQATRDGWHAKSTPITRALSRFARANEPHLTARASAVMAAVSESMGVQCDNCMHVENCDDPEINMNCPLAAIRRAWRTE